MPELSGDELSAVLPRLRAIAGELNQRDGRTDKSDLLQQMCQAALERSDWPERRTVSYVAQYCRYAALHFKRHLTNTGRFSVEPLSDGDELLADHSANPETILLEREEHAAVRSWFETIMSGDALTPAERRTLAEVQAGHRNRCDRTRRTPSQRASKSYHIHNIRLKFPNPLVTA